MRVFSLPFAGGVAAVAVLVAACGGSAGSADSTPTDREAAGLAMSTQLCITNDTMATQNVRWMEFDTNDQKKSLDPGDSTCGEGSRWARDDVTVEVWQNSDRGNAWAVDFELAAGNLTVGYPYTTFAFIDSKGSNPKTPCDEDGETVSECFRFGDYSVGDTQTYAYTPWGEASPVTVTVTRIADTEWKEFRVTLS